MSDQKKILIIEDDRFLSLILKGRLEKEGFTVMQAFDGQAGIEALKKEIPDLIILDLILPDTTGFDVCTQIKKQVALAKTIVVMMTVKDDLENIRKGFDVGADDYIVKPSEHGFLARKIKLYLGMRG